jgi:hypothetical protein
VVSGKYLYLGVYWGNLVVFDISNPVAPQYVTDGWSLPPADPQWPGWPAGWGLGRVWGEYLAIPSISHFHLVDVPRDGEGLIGPITVEANLRYAVYLPLCLRNP